MILSRSSSHQQLKDGNFLILSSFQTLYFNTFSTLFSFFLQYPAAFKCGPVWGFSVVWSWAGYIKISGDLYENTDLRVHLVQAMVFLVVMYGCESWTIKKAEHQRTDAFELWCQRRLLRVPWTARRSNQSILKEISPEYSLEELMLKLKLQYFGHLIKRTDSLEKTPMLGKIEGRRRRG